MCNIHISTFMLLLFLISIICEWSEEDTALRKNPLGWPAVFVFAAVSVHTRPQGHSFAGRLASLVVSRWF